MSFREGGNLPSPPATLFCFVFEKLEHHAHRGVLEWLAHIPAFLFDADILFRLCLPQCALFLTPKLMQGVTVQAGSGDTWVLEGDHLKLLRLGSNSGKWKHPGLCLKWFLASHEGFKRNWTDESAQVLLWTGEAGGEPPQEIKLLQKDRLILSESVKPCWLSDLNLYLKRKKSLGLGVIYN